MNITIYTYVYTASHWNAAAAVGPAWGRVGAAPPADGPFGGGRVHCRGHSCRLLRGGARVRLGNIEGPGRRQKGIWRRAI